MRTIDLTTRIDIRGSGVQDEKMLRKIWSGHVGTHFDAMGMDFPEDYMEQKGVVFDVSGIEGREITTDDIDLRMIEGRGFVALYSGFIDEAGYGTERYFHEHPVLSRNLIEALLAAGARIIAIDFAGVRRGAEHHPADMYCAERGTFVVENLCNLDKVLGGKSAAFFEAGTYPVNFAGMSGLPCRVVARVYED